MTKIAIVTGSSSGIGQESARELAAKGFHVVFACRTESKAEAAIADAAVREKLDAKASMSFIQLDTSSMKSVKAFAATFLEKFDRLDVLVHNAGTGYLIKKDRVTEDGLEGFFQTNYLGPFLLTKLLLDILKKSNGRVLCLSSIEHWEGSYDFEKVSQKTGVQSYATTKLMIMLHAYELRKRHGITAVAVNPGGVKSNIWWYMRGWRKTVFNAISNAVLLTTRQGCQSTVYGATVAELPPGPVYLSPYKQNGLCPHRSDYVNFYHGPNVAKPDPKALREEKWAELWEFSEKAIKPFLDE
jgi:NAD(P)-dependent dehydrogenase (short-subunit alcohol dehydrogenase family)